MKLLRGLDVVAADCPSTPVALNKANAADRRT